MNEVEIINVPSQPKKFFVIWGAVSASISGRVDYCLIDCTSGTPQISTPQEITSTIHTAGFCITSLLNNQRELYISQFGGLYKYSITSTGISYVEDVVTSTDPVLNDPDYFWTHNVELKADETKIAWCGIYDNAEKIFLVDLNAQGGYLSSSIVPVNKGIITGIEFPDINGSNLIYASCSGSNGGIQQINYITGQVYAMTTNGSYGNTSLQKATDGYIYAVSNDGDNMGRINPISNTFYPSVISGIDIKSSNYYDLDYVIGNMYKLPEDRTLYSTLDMQISATHVSCPGNNDGSATAAPVGGTPPYTYLWTPEGLTTQTINNLQVGTYTCCITDAIDDVVCKSIDVSLPPNLFDYPNEFLFNYPVTMTDWDKTFEKGIRVASGTHVTFVDCDMQFGKDAKIIVEPGATFTLDNSTMTNFAACGSMWQLC